MTKILRVCALQLPAHDRSAFEGGGIAFHNEIERAAREHDLIVLPEGTFPAYVLGDDRIDDAAISRAIDDLRAIAKASTCVIVAGAAVRRDGELFNSAVVVDADGSIAGSADKIFLWHFDRKWFSPGRSIAPIATHAGRLGVMICADGRMPMIARTLVDRGAELLVMPTAWVTSGRNPNALENVQADLLARVRAFENGVPFVAANKCGVEMEMVAYCGKSQIVDARGEILAIAPERDAASLSASIALGEPQPQRAHAQVIPARTVPAGSVRIAFAFEEPRDAQARLRTLDATELITPQSDECIDARMAFDPSVLPAYRAAGYRRIVLDARESHSWLEAIARARALELRMYVIVFDRAAHRAYAVDPDGVVIAGTFGSFTIASAVIDYERTAQTTVAPGTDVAEGLERIAAIAGARV